MFGRSLTICLAVSGFAFLAGLPVPASAGPGVLAEPQSSNTLVQEAGYYKRRWRQRNGAYVRAPFTEVDTHNGTWVRAPFVRVYRGRGGTWVRAPFVNLFDPD